MDQFSDLNSIIQLVKRRALYFLIPFIILGLAGSAGVILLPAIYRSQATILVESQQIPADLVRSTVTALADERLQVIQQRALSRDNILDLARKFSLFDTSKSLTPTELVERVKSRIDISPVNTAALGRRSREDRLVIAFTVSYEDERPQRAAQVANELVTIILSADAKTRSEQAAETSSFLEKESNRLSGELRQVETEIAKFRLDNTDALPEKLGFNMALKERLETNIAQVASDIRGIEEQKRFLVFEANVRTVSGRSPAGTSGPVDIDTQIEGLRSEIAAKSAIYADSHPEMRAAKKALAALETERDARRRALASTKNPAEALSPASGIEDQLTEEKLKALDGRVSFLKQQGEEFQASVDRLAGVISRTPEVSAKLATLERQQGGLQKSLDEIGGKLAQARLGQRLEEDQQSERFEVIEQPIAPDQPSRPDRKKFLALVLGIAGAAGGGLAFVTEFLDSRLRTASEIESRLALRPLSVIDYIPLRGEKRRRKWLIAALILAVVFSLLAALAAVHFLYEPLDFLAYKILKRF